MTKDAKHFNPFDFKLHEFDAELSPDYYTNLNKQHEKELKIHQMLTLGMLGNVPQPEIKQEPRPYNATVKISSLQDLKTVYNHKQLLAKDRK